MSGALQAVYMNQRSFSVSPNFVGRFGSQTQDLYNVCQGAVFDSSGNLIVLGGQQLYGGSGERRKGIVFKINKTKELVYNKLYTGPSDSSNAFDYDAAIDASDNMYSVGTRSNNNNTFTGLTTKFNSSGVVQWSRSLGNIDSGVGDGLLLLGVGVDSSGNVYVAGYARDTNASTYNGVFAKYNSSGTIQFKRKIVAPGSNNFIGYNLFTKSNGDSFFVAYYRQNDGEYYGALVKYNSSGTLQYFRSYRDNAGFTGFTDVIVDSSDNTYVSFYRGIIKFDSGGNIAWQRSMSNTNFSSLAVDSSGNVYAAGEGPSYQGIIAKFNSSGTIQWQRKIDATLASPNQKYWQKITIDSEGNLGLTGRTATISGAGASNTLILLANLPNNGAFTGTYTVGSTVYTISESTETITTSSQALYGSAYSEGSISLFDESVSLTESTNTLGSLNTASI